MLESLSQVAAILLLEREDVRAAAARLSARRERREIPAPGRAGRSAAARDLAGPAPRVAGPGAGDRLSCGDQVVAECELLLGLMPDRTRDRSDRHRPSRRRRSATGTTIGPHATIGPHVRIGADCRIGASAVVDGWTEIGDGTEIYPFASIGLVPQDLKFQGEETRLVDRQAQHLPRVRDHPPRHARRRRRHRDRRPQRVHGLRARRARLPCRQRHHLRQHGDARRPRHGRGLREHQRRLGRAPVLPRRPPRVHRRLLGRSPRTRCRTRAPSAAVRRGSSAPTPSA